VTGARTPTKTPLPGITVQLTGDGEDEEDGTITNERGEFEIRPRGERHTLLFYYSDAYQQKVPYERCNGIHVELDTAEGTNPP
jgi:hypothetical protein